MPENTTPLLTANYSTGLAEMLSNGTAPVDGAETGPWFTPQQITGFRAKHPEYIFHFHAGGMASQVRKDPQAVDKLRAWIAVTDTPWISVHIEMLDRLIFSISSQLGINLPPPKPERAIDRFLKDIQIMKDTFQLPLILENLASLPAAKYHYACDPLVLSEILCTCGCKMLLDVAHARCAASYLDMDIYDYLAHFALDEVRQVHLSGPWVRRGHLRDAHEPLEDTDYEILAWLMDRCQPEVITLEYYKEKSALEVQLPRLRSMIDAAYAE